MDGTTVANRLKGQLERYASFSILLCVLQHTFKKRLTKTYRKHAARLQQTGGGLDDENLENSQNEQLKYYIPGEGPDESTPRDALNLWRMYFLLFRSNFNLTLILIEQIERDFKFFPRLHKIFTSRPNVTPIVITTALGPQGRKTVWYQPPDDAPTSSTNRLPSTPTHSPSRVFGTDVTQNIVNETPVLSQLMPATLPPLDSSARRAPKSSGVSREAIEKARSYIEKVPQKRTLLNTLVELQE